MSLPVFHYRRKCPTAKERSTYKLIFLSCNYASYFLPLKAESRELHCCQNKDINRIHTKVPSRVSLSMDSRTKRRTDREIGSNWSWHYCGCTPHGLNIVESDDKLQIKLLVKHIEENVLILGAPHNSCSTIIIH